MWRSIGSATRLIGPALTAAGLALACGAEPAVAGEARVRPAIVEVAPSFALPAPFSAEELQVIRHIVGRIRAGEPSGSVSPEDLSKATGVSIAAIRSLDTRRLRRGVLEELRRLDGQPGGPPGSEILTGCSLERDLNGATEEELQRYHAEKARDGERFEGWLAPDFVLPSTTGGALALSELEGRRVALAFVTGHCSHSLEILRRLSSLRGEPGLEDLVIVGVYVNSGSLEDVASWTRYLKIDFPLLVAETPEIADRFGFQTVPTLFLVGADRRVLMRLVGERDVASLRESLMEIDSIEKAGRLPSIPPSLREP